MKSISSEFTRGWLEISLNSAVNPCYAGAGVYSALVVKSGGQQRGSPGNEIGLRAKAPLPRPGTSFLTLHVARLWRSVANSIFETARSSKGESSGPGVWVWLATFRGAFRPLAYHALQSFASGFKRVGDARVVVANFLDSVPINPACPVQIPCTFSHPLLPIKRRSDFALRFAGFRAFVRNLTFNWTLSFSLIFEVYV